jgi:hypothetical protein
LTAAAAASPLLPWSMIQFARLLLLVYRSCLTRRMTKVPRCGRGGDDWYALVVKLLFHNHHLIVVLYLYSDDCCRVCSDCIDTINTGQERRRQSRYYKCCQADRVLLGVDSGQHRFVFFV